MGPNYRLLGLGAAGFVAGQGGFYFAQSGYTFLGGLLALASIATIAYVVIRGQIEFFRGPGRGKKE